ncbi:restriction endonuclease subunit S [Roseivivax sp. CAU 1753]
MTWNSARLSDIAKIDRSQVDPGKITSGTKYLGLEHIEAGGRILGAQSVQRGELKSSKFQFSKEHVLYGKLRPYLAKISLPDFEGICSTDILPVRPGPDLDRKFLAYYLRQPSVVQEANGRSTGANLPRLSPKALAEMDIPCPPIDEQRRIAEILDKADAIRRKGEQALDLADEFLKSVFLKMFDVTFRGIEQNNKVSLAELVERVTVGHVGPSTKGLSSSGVPFLRTQNIGSNGISYDGLLHITEEFASRLKKSELREGDIIISRHITDRIRSAIIPHELDGANCANIVVVRPGPDVPSSFIHMLLQTGTAQSALLGRQTGSAQRVINTKAFQAWEISEPSLGALGDFDKIFQGSSNARNRLQNAVANSENLFSALSQRAFRGDL